MSNVTLSFNRTYAISDLRQFTKSRSKEFRKNLFQKSKILVIDDKIDNEDYPFQRSIKFLREQCNCNIATKVDLENLSDAEGYHVIICDKDFEKGLKLGGRRSDGIWLLNKLYREYPDKKYILFSMFQEGLHRISSVKAELWDKNELIRNSGTKGFSEEVLRVMDELADPAIKWEAIRRMLLDEGVSIHSVAELESAYVKSIIKGKESIYSSVANKIDVTTDNDIDLHEVIKSASRIIGTSISLLGLF